MALQFLGGHPETSYDVMVVTVAFVLFRLMQLGRDRAPLARPLLAAALGLGVGTALAAIAIVPFAELLFALQRPRYPQTARGDPYLA